MNIAILGAAGFIGTNLALELVKDESNVITLVDKDKSYFSNAVLSCSSNIILKESSFELENDYDSLVKNQDIVYHLVSTIVPTNSNQHIPQDLMSNVILTSYLLEACVRQKVKKVVFISSGGTVYGKEKNCPLSEDTATNPICSYGVQKVTIEKLLYLYKYMYDLDYRVIRLANPYGPYQRPNGVLGAVTTFTYRALMNEEISVFGDGSVVRDYIYIDDAIRGIMNIVNGESKHRTFNLGCGYGTSLNQVLEAIRKSLGLELNVVYKPGRKVDVPVNFLDISRYEQSFGKLNAISLEEGIKKTAEFMKSQYGID